MTKKIKFIFVCVILVSFIIVIIPKGTKLSNAVININNGDIAYCYLDSESSIATLNICVFDKYGTKKFTKRIYSNGGSYADMLFKNNDLYICVGRTNVIYAYDENGNSIKEIDISNDEMKNINPFDGWESSFGKKVFVLDNHLYEYKEPTIFSRYSKLTISYDDKNIIIFEF